jgi:hypothetical protein
MKSTGTHAVGLLNVTYRDIEGFPSEQELENMRRPYSSRQTNLLDTHEPWRGAEITSRLTSDNGEHELPATINVWERDRMLRGRGRNRNGLNHEILTPYSYQLNNRQVSQLSESLLADGEEGLENKRLILDMLKSFNEDISDIQVVSLHGRRPTIYLKHNKLGPAPISIFGDAVRRVVLMASTLADLRGGGLLLIDELETGIHADNLQLADASCVGVRCANCGNNA